MITARPSSRLSGFYQKNVSERVAVVAQWAGLDKDETAALDQALSLAQADKLIENVVGRFALPLGIAPNFLINGKDFLIPLVVEEPSIVAALSYAARLTRAGGGFVTGSTEQVMIGQVQLLDVADPQRAESAILAAQEDLLAAANTSPTIARLGGGPREIRVRHLPDTPTGPMLVVHLLFDCRDAMGANAINTAVETLAPRLETLSGGRALLRILSNLSDERRAWAQVAIPAAAFATPDFSGEEVIEAIADANALAVADPYRAATHNKGIFNGIDPLLIATGNDWRAAEAGGHAFAARDGQYRALTEWWVGGGDQGTESGEPGARSDSSQFPVPNSHSPILFGRLELPLAVGTVGGATRSHPTAQVALKILGVSGARELSEVAAAVGLAQNLAALRALVTDGIQRGHMRLHARQMAVAAGAPPEKVDWVAQQLIEAGEIRVERARDVLGIGK